MAHMPKDDYIDVTGTLRKAQRQIESERTKTGLRSLRALEPEDLRLPERLRFYYLRGLAHLQRQDATRAMPDLDRALALARQLHNAEAATRVSGLIGWAHRQQGRPAMGLEYHRRAYRAAQEGQVSDPEFQAMIAAELAADHLALGDHTQANEVYRDAVRRYEGKTSPARTATLAWGLSVTALRLGDLPQARSYAQRAIELYEGEVGQADAQRKALARRLLPQARVNYALILLALDSLDEAHRQLQTALSEASDDPTLQATIQQALADVALRRGRQDEAQTAATAAVDLSRRAKQPPLLGQALRQAAQVAAAGGDYGAAFTHYQNAVAALDSGPNRSQLSEVLFNYARLLQQQGRTDEAAQRFEQAYRAAGATQPSSGGLAPPDQPGYTRQPATSIERRQARAGRGTPGTAATTAAAEAPATNGSTARPATRRPRRAAAPAPAETTPGRRGRRPRTPAVEA
jgi:tetratricopeptide (TPR) repeat protein